MKIKPHGRYQVFIDGGCGPINPGGTASYGVYTKTPDGSVIEEWGVHGSGPLMSNNVAEYAALFRALEMFTTDSKQSPIDAEIEVFSDSQLVVKQMTRQWNIKHGLYFEIAQRALHLSKRFSYLKFTWILREQNTFADELSNRALREAGVKLWNIEDQLKLTKKGDHHGE